MKRVGPPNEQLPEGDGKEKTPGPRPDLSGAEQILLRVVKVGQLMHRDGMSLMEIWVWNNEPDQVAKGWGYGYRHVHRLCKRAKLLGADFLCKSHEQNILTTLMEWMELKRHSVVLGDMRAACYCEKEIAKLRDSYVGKSMRHLTAGNNRDSFDWKTNAKAATVTVGNPPEGAAEATFTPVS